jgi:glycosyltransferase involved in cell wall biosynthesis
MRAASQVIKSASIIIKSYNYAEFVGEAITSALSQTFPNVEVIVVENASTDDSLSVIRPFRDRIVLIALEKNVGPAGAEYAGFVRATGDMIMFLDSDDILDPTAVEEAARHFDSDTSKVQFYLEVVDTKKSPLGFTYPKKMPREEDIEGLLFGLGAYPLAPSSGNAYSRRFLEQVLPCTDNDLKFSEDLYTALLAPLYGKVRVCQKVLGRYRLHGGNDYGTPPGVPMSPRKMRTHVISIAAGQRILEEHCARLNISIEPGLHWKWPYYCKRRLILLKADPATHPFPDDRPFKLAWNGLVASVQYPGLPLANRLKLIATFFSLPVLPSRLAHIWMPVFDEGERRQVMNRFRWMLRSGPRRAPSPEEVPRG